jgi:hypothetical protein
MKTNQRSVWNSIGIIYEVSLSEKEIKQWLADQNERARGSVRMKEEYLININI